MEHQPVKLSLHDQVVLLEIDRAAKHNAIDQQTLMALGDRLGQVRVGPARAMVFASSGGGAFCAGGDIAEMSEMSADTSVSYTELGRQCAAAVEALPFPVIAAVHGHALGGGLELAMACDVIVASDSAQFALPEVTLGIIPGFGGIPRLVRRIGFSRAQWMALSGDRIDAKTALEWGLVNQVVSKTDVRAVALALAQRFARCSSSAVRRVKEVLWASSSQQVSAGLSHEANCFRGVFEHPDRTEGMRAFVERRQAWFM